MGNNKAYGFLKHVIAALKKKTRAIKTRLVIFSLLHNNKKLFVGSISHRLNALVGQQKKNHCNSLKPEGEEEEEDIYYRDEERQQQQQSPSQPQTIVFYNNNAMCKVPSACETETEIMELTLQQQEKGEIEEEDDDGGGMECKYPNLTYSLFDSEFYNPGRSVIDIVKNSKEDNGEEFKLEDEIDRVADLFIRRFHHQMRMHNQNS